MQSPGLKNKSKKRAEKGPAQRLRQRTAILILLILVLGFGAAVLRLTYLTTVQSSELQESAVDLQLADTTVSAKRGTIYDANGNVLAESASVWQVVMSPVNFKNDKQRQAAAKGLSEIFDLEYNDVLDDTKQQSHYVVVKRRIESDEREKVLELIDTLKKDYSCSGVIQLLDDYKRYYPKNSLASSVIGFTGSDDQGLEGIEYEYDSYLSGTPGRIITAQNARGTDMPFRYEQNVESEDGNNVYLTIDETIQSICEKYMQKGVEDNNVLNKGVCIAMDVNTGAILAMVTTDGYDLNNPYELSAKDKKKIKSTPKKKQAEAESAALSNMWRNKAVADTYMPGSVFKMCVASAALEENLVNEKTSFTCTGSISVEGETIHCSNISGHGTQNFVEVISNSCNPAFIQIGQMLGAGKFRQYYQGFGFSDKTGIDLPGEAEDSFWKEGKMGGVDLAVASFGQNFTITPIQMITACAAVSNGGYVVQPHVVSKITDSKGNVIKTVDKKVKRQVISDDTSKKMNEYLEYNTERQGAAAGYISGYKVAGKTGTTEKRGVTKFESSFSEDYISSFCGYAPADDPQIAMLVFFDTPDGDAYYGSQVSSPVFINIMSEVLPYLDVKTSYTDEELGYVDASAGDYTGVSVDEAKTAVEADGFTATVKGNGSTVISQIPTVSSGLQKGGSIVLYTDSDSQSETVSVPSLIGLSPDEVNDVASAYGLNVSFSGATTSSGTSSSQNVEAGTSVSPGTVITVSFADSSSTLNE
ncbi:Sporulation-specific penicillin-binding protein [Ruminococcus bromii]|nr:penicillin-binding transpeptidase domain-containing protein [Ruminococcus bromii]PKD30888.1 Sporulation-specific penicillin-binding protein [Ruminococcus bromii]SPE91704.1 Peptidoglycan synthase FtsI precursor,peptidoglyc an synthase FtsI,Membrane carboxypeptidase/penicillin-bindi ng protein,stage V sporulation protein D,Penicillin binding protein transpeptidase domain [Ruminococcus bromii L2-63]